MKTKVKMAALFVFNSDPMCFIHVLLNGLSLADRGYDVKIIVEGAATQLIPALDKSDNPQHRLWQAVKEKGLVDGACKACATKTAVLGACKDQGLKLLDDMSGHPSMSAYMDQGYQVITF